MLKITTTICKDEIVEDKDFSAPSVREALEADNYRIKIDNKYRIVGRRYNKNDMGGYETISIDVHPMRRWYLGRHTQKVIRVCKQIIFKGV